MWAVYDGALLVGRWPELPRNHQWCTVLAGLYKHIYRGFNDVAHCLPYTLASWDCQERTEALHWEGKLGSAQSGHKRASRPRRRSRSSSRCHSRTPALRDWSGHSCCSPPNMLPSCHCGEPLSPGVNTMPKLTLAVNILAYAQSSCSSGEWPGPPWMMRMCGEMTSKPCTCVVWCNRGGHRELAVERMEASPGWQ